MRGGSRGDTQPYIMLRHEGERALTDEVLMNSLNREEEIYFILFEIKLVD